jgi:hypothetical protein
MRPPVSFRPRIGPALGVVPTIAAQRRMSRDAATGAPIAVTYHGGSVMTGGVTVHTIFWAPAGYAFEGSPGGGVPSYEQLIKQFLADVAHDSGAPGTCTTSECDAYTVLAQYAEGTAVGAVTPGEYAVSYDPAADSVDDTNPYPARVDQCASPAGTDTCLTDGQIQAEVDRVVEGTPGAPRGLANVWLVFLPPGVDECVVAGSCGTNAFAGYHAISNLDGHGVTVYAVIVDPIIELQVPPGGDPNGFPDAEATVDTAAHELVEAITDPEGTGWMDPSGFEVGDKCDVGPQVGTPLGFASDGSPYNQVIDSHRYLIQDFWANLDSAGGAGCVQATTSTANPLPLPQVNLRQFNPVVSGNVNRLPGGGIGVRVTLLREGPDGAPQAVARASTTTAADGSWSVSLAPHAPGDDRDEIDVDYSGAGAPQPSHQVILTGNGGDPFEEAGWTGWSDLDAGAAVASAPGPSSVTLAPCFQTGVLTLTIDGVATPQSPTDLCDTQTDAATVPTGPIAPRDVLAVTSNDNRAFAPPSAPAPNPLGGLVSLTVRLGEAGAVPQFTSPLAPLFTPTGVPVCSADLELEAVFCVGLVAGRSYTVDDGRAHAGTIADQDGSLLVDLPVRGGDSVVLSNGSRALSTLHVARLRAAIDGEEAFLARGSCQPGDYYGAPPSGGDGGPPGGGDGARPSGGYGAAPSGGYGAPPGGGSATDAVPPPGAPTTPDNGGIALTGEICPLNGRAAGLPSDAIAQTDDLSGGLTETEVPDLEDTSPIEGETVYGSFVALAETGLSLPGNLFLPTDLVTRVSVAISPMTGGRPVFRARNVDTPFGVNVPALYPGTYVATWSLTDTNGDTRLVQTRFIERPGGAARANAAISCRRLRPGRLRCALRFAGAFAHLNGQVRIRIARGGRVVALGHGRVRDGRASLTVRELRVPAPGAWTVTLVLVVPHEPPQTIVLRPKRLL